MIGTELTKGQGLGNQLFCYISARCIALDNGYEFATLGMENMANNIHSDCGLYFMDLESGLNAERSDFENIVEKVRIRHDCGIGCHIHRQPD